MLERSLFTRIALTCEVEIASNEALWQTNLLDLSFKGALVVRPEGFTPSIEQPLDITISLKSGKQRISFDGHVTYINDQNIGVHCESLNIVKITELRQLIEQNTHSDNRLKKTLASLNSH